VPSAKEAGGAAFAFDCPESTGYKRALEENERTGAVEIAEFTARFCGADSASHRIAFFAYHHVSSFGNKFPYNRSIR